MLSENDLIQITARVARHASPVAVGLFGSYAIGTAHDGSDLDVVVIQRSAQPQNVRRQAMRRLLFGLLQPVDIHVFTPEEWEEQVYAHLSFMWVIARQVRLYYWTEEARRIVPSLFTNTELSQVRNATSTLPGNLS